MKNLYKLTVIFCTILFFISTQGFTQGGPPQEIFNSVDSGSWTDISSWEGDQYPDTMDLNNSVININPGHHILLDGNFSSKNDITINVANNAKLEVTKDFILKNHFEINVHEGGIFIVGGDVHIDAGRGGPARGQLIIDGEVDIEGDLTGNADVTGDGCLYVGGIIGDGICFDESDVKVVNGEKTSPHNLAADVGFNSSYYTVLLGWDFDASQQNSHGIVGFIVSRNDTVLDIVDYAAKSAEYNYTDEGLEAGATPIYEVYGLYEDDIMSEPAVKSFESSPLPIELLHFNAKPESADVFIEWATAAEINNDYFSIERSIDGKNWDVIGYVDGAGNSNHTRYYEYKDANPIEGVSYYRLKQTDYDGQYEYFDPVAVNFVSNKEDTQILNIRTNPYRLDVILNNQDYNAELLVAGLHGRIIHRQNIEVSLHAQEIPVSFSSDHSGEILIIRLNSGNNTDTKKIMVN